MASTFSKGKSIELIGSGEQAGVWGNSTNQNLQKVDQCFTQYAEVKIGTGTGEIASPSTWVVGTHVLTWVLDEDGDALAAGTQGRAPLVEFTSGDTNPPTTRITAKIRGESPNTYPPRFFYVRNATGQTMDFFIDSSTTASKCLEVLNGETVPLITYIDSASDANHYVYTTNDAPFIHTLYMIDRSKGSLSGSDPSFVLDANSHSNWHGSDTVAIGKEAGNPAVGTTSQDQDVFIGSLAGASAASVVDSVFIGYKAGNAVTTSDDNVFIGSEAGVVCTSTDNVAIGYRAAHTVTSNIATAVGSDALRLVTGNNNVAFGRNAMEGRISNGANNSVAVGASALQLVDTSCKGNVAVGHAALYGEATAGVSGTSNVGVGYQAGMAISSGDHNFFCGDTAGQGAYNDGTGITGDSNMGIGYRALFSLTTGDNNTALGRESGSALTTQDKNILIGFETGKTTTGADSILIIDHEDKGAAAVQQYGQFIWGDMANDRLNFNSSNSSGSHVKIQNTTSAGSGYKFLECVADSDGTPATKFQVRGDGQVQVNGVEVHAADYADMFEWSDGNKESSDRIGYSVVLEEDGKVAVAIEDDDPSDIVGVVSGTACMIGNAAWGAWEGKFLKDEYGRSVTDSVDGRTTQVLNPEYDEGREYVGRLARTEWAVIGLVGRIHIRKRAPKNPNWRKIRNVSDTTEEWLVR